MSVLSAPGSDLIKRRSLKSPAEALWCCPDRVLVKQVRTVASHWQTERCSDDQRSRSFYTTRVILVLQTIPPGAKRPCAWLQCFSWKICFHYSGRSNPVKEIEARFESINSLPFYQNYYGTVGTQGIQIYCRCTRHSDILSVHKAFRYTVGTQGIQIYCRYTRHLDMLSHSLLCLDLIQSAIQSPCGIYSPGQWVQWFWLLHFLLMLN